MDVATEAFLEAAGIDLQRQLGVSARVEDLTIDDGPPITVRAELSIGRERLVLIGKGATLVEAYAGLIHAAPTPVLASAFRQVVDPSKGATRRPRHRPAAPA